MSKFLANLKKLVGKLLAFVGIFALAAGGTTTWLCFSETAKAQAGSVLPGAVSAVVTPPEVYSVPMVVLAPAVAAAGLFFTVLGCKWARGGRKKG